jgi:hypothetical protein
MMPDPTALGILKQYWVVVLLGFTALARVSPRAYDKLRTAPPAWWCATVTPTARDAKAPSTHA